MAQTSRFAISLLAAGQGQKEVTHNEALQHIELLLCPSVAGAAVNTPPVNPPLGSCFLIGAAPTGAWIGHPHGLAGWTGGGWRFVAPVEGLRARLNSSGEQAVYRNGAWETGIVDAAEVRVGGQAVVGARRPAIAAPTGGSTVDGESRAAIAAILAALRAHGLIAV